MHSVFQRAQDISNCQVCDMSTCTMRLFLQHWRLIGEMPLLRQTLLKSNQGRSSVHCCR